jgi:hypothetical protein
MASFACVCWFAVWSPEPQPCNINQLANIPMPHWGITPNLPRSAEPNRISQKAYSRKRGSAEETGAVPASGFRVGPRWPALAKSINLPRQSFRPFFRDDCGAVNPGRSRLSGGPNHKTVSPTRMQYGGPPGPRPTAGRLLRSPEIRPVTAAITAIAPTPSATCPHLPRCPSFSRALNRTEVLVPAPPRRRGFLWLFRGWGRPTAGPLTNSPRHPKP